MFRLSAVQTGLLLEVALVGLALLLGFFFGYSPLTLWRPDGSTLVTGILGTLAMVLALGVLTVLPLAPIRRLFEVMREFYRDFFADSSVFDLALISLAAGVGEEFFFRGFLQQALSDLGGPLVGIVVASIVFGLAHMVTITYAILAALFGLFLGWLMLFTGDLAAPVFTHALYDFAALMYLRYRTRPLKP